MKTREQFYSKESACILRDVSMYRVLREEQLLRLYPGKKDLTKKLLAYLVRERRISLGDDGLYYAGETPEKDDGLMAAVWVLADMIDQVEYHSTGEYPIKIIFFADGEVYGIVYTAYGKENLISHALSTAEKDPPRYIILVDTPEQIADIQAPNISGFCTVSREGEVQYYQRE